MSKKLDEVLKQLNKTFGANTVMTLGTVDGVKENLLSTGSLMIDKILGGGLPFGRVMEVYGPESSGKSSFALQAIATAQEQGLVAALIDTEQATDPVYAKQLGVDLDKLIFSQPSSGEEAFEIIDTLAKSGEVNLIVLDSIAAATPKVILEGEMGDATIGAHARLISKFCSKIIGTLNNQNCGLIVINQTRTKINTGFSMGDPTTTTGGHALKFYASQRIEVKKTTAIKESDEVIGYNTKITVKKNKIAPPMKSCVIPFMFGHGFGGSDEVINLAIEYGLIDKSGAWMTTHDGQRIQGLARVREYYNTNKDLYDELKEKVVSQLKGIEITQQYEVDPETGEIIE